MAEFGDIITNDPAFATALALIALVLAALFANFVVKALLVRLIDRLLGRTPYGRDEELRRHGVVKRLANVVPALVITIGIKLVPHLPGQLVAVVQNVANAFILLTIALALGSALNVVDTVYHRRPRARNRPIKSYLQVAKIAVYVIASTAWIRKTARLHQALVEGDARATSRICPSRPATSPRDLLD